MNQKKIEEKKYSVVFDYRKDSRLTDRNTNLKDQKGNKFFGFFLFELFYQTEFVNKLNCFFKKKYLRKIEWNNRKGRRTEEPTIFLFVWIECLPIDLDEIGKRTRLQKKYIQLYTWIDWLAYESYWFIAFFFPLSLSRIMTNLSKRGNLFSH